MSVVVAIQARTGSSRLPGKVLAELAGRPLLRFQLDRLAAVDCGPVVVATSTEPGDDAVANLAHAADIPVVRGSEPDVLERFAEVVRQHHPTTIVRLTGDCPLTDPALVDEVVQAHLTADADYTSNVFPRTYPKGLDVEVVRAEALLEAVDRAERGSEREHVTPYLYRRPERFRMANVQSGEDLGQEWWVVDTAADLESMRSMVAELDDPVDAGWRDIWARVGSRHFVRPDEVHLQVTGAPSPGSCPWVRTWTASRDGTRLGIVQVAVGEGHVQRTIVERSPDATADDDHAIFAALDGILVHDEQVRL